MVSCPGCDKPLAANAVVCETCATDPFAMEDARGRVGLSGDLERLARLYDPSLAYLHEGQPRRIWEDNLLGSKNTIPEHSAWLNHQSVKLVPTSARRILEIGPGSGYAIPRLSERCPSAEYYGVDLSPKTLDALRQRHRGTFAVGAIEDLPWPGVAFDAILMLEVLEHISAPRTFGVLAALRDRLSDTGVLIISVPLREDLRRSYFLCAHCGHAVHQIGHVRSYTPELLSAELRVSGLAVETFLPLAGGTYWGLRRQTLMPFFPTRIKPMNVIVRCRRR